MMAKLNRLTQANLSTCKFLLFFGILFIQWNKIAGQFSNRVTIRYCVPDELKDLCDQMALTIPGSLSCITARDKLDCINLIYLNEADVTNLDAKDLYLAGKVSNLEPFVREEYGTARIPYQTKAAVMVKRNSRIRSLTDLRGKRTCHSSYGSEAGWHIPIGIMARKLNLFAFDCRGELQAMSSFFNSSCTPGRWSNDLLVDRKLILLTIALELLILIKFAGFNSLNSSTQLKSKAFRFIQLCLISIFAISLLIILLGCSNLSTITATVQLSIITCSLAIVPLLASFQNSYHLSTGQHLARFIGHILRQPITSSFLIINFYALTFAIWLSAFLLKVDWTVNWKRYPITSIIGCLLSNLAINLLNLTFISMRKLSLIS